MKRKKYQFLISVHSGSHGYMHHLVETDLFDIQDYLHSTMIYDNANPGETDYRCSYILGRLGYVLDDIDSAHMEFMTLIIENNIY